MNSHFYEVMGFQAPATAANMLLNAMATEEEQQAIRNEITFDTIEKIGALKKVAKFARLTRAEVRAQFEIVVADDCSSNPCNWYFLLEAPEGSIEIYFHWEDNKLIVDLADTGDCCRALGCECV